MEQIPWTKEGRRSKYRDHRGARRIPLVLAGICVALMCPNEGQSRNPWPQSVRAGFLLPITLSKGTDLRFGEVFVGPSPGTCVVTPQGARSSTGGVGLGGAFSTGAASFTAGGDPLAVFSIVLPASATMTNSVEAMMVDDFTSDPSGSGQLDAIGNQTLTVGATLNVGANQAPGDYDGIFSVTVAYN